MSRWLPVPGFEGYYSVSDMGEVRAEPRMVRHSSGGCWKRVSGRVLKQIDDGAGYMKVNFSREGKHFNRRVHQLVAETFLGPCPDGMEVAHDDGIRAHCALSNLRYDTPLGNAADRARHDTNVTGERNHGAKLTETEIRAIRAAQATGTELARVFGISVSQACRIRAGRVWKHLTTNGAPQ